MLNFSPLKMASIALACLIAVMFALPNVFSKETVQQWPAWVPRQQLALGLDLRGGAHLLFQMDTEQLRRDWLASVRKDARKRMSEANIQTSGIGLTGNTVVVRLADPAQADNALRALRRMVEQVGNALLGNTGPNLDIQRGDTGAITIRATPLGDSERIQQALAAAIENIRRRIDALGTSEPLIVQQGLDRILVQVPGYDDTERLKDVIKGVAKLTFHEVHTIVPNEQIRNTRIPPEFKAYEPSKERRSGSGERDNVVYILREEPIVEGVDLTNASPGFDEGGRPAILFQFNQRGARAFGDFTTKHVKEPFAIVLDGAVLSAPTIITPIREGRGQITGNFDTESAKDFAIQLRSGALPASLTVVEERTVGPSLGKDSIEAGMRAGLIGGAATIIMSLIAYGTFGVFAVIGLAVNGIMILAIMSAVGSTLTLPGIAGLVLTIGMAVDSNVLIFERIREELRAGKSAVAAIDAGFNRALISIADSQLTTLAAAIIMFWLGSGPIRGFAVTLTIGIFTSVFTAVTVTRLLVALWLKSERRRPGKIEVPV